MKTEKTSLKIAAGRRKQVLILVPYIPSPRVSGPGKTVHDTLTLASSGHEVMCLPEDKPLSARLDEAALASRGISVYAFPPVTRADISNRLKVLITANPRLEIIGFVGLEAMRRHLIDARLFAPEKSFFAVLGREDAAALGRAPGKLPAGGASSEADRDLLSCCDSIFCEDAADAEFLRRSFYVDARTLKAMPAALSAPGPRRRDVLKNLGILSRLPSGQSGLPGAFKARKLIIDKKAPYFAEINRLVCASPDIPAWAAISRPFSGCSTLWFRLKTVLQTFKNAGLVLPSPAVLKNSGGLPASALMLEAASLNRQGVYSEQLLADDLPLFIFTSEAFMRVGGFDTRFSSPGCAWTDLGLRMRQAGFRVITAEDAVISSRPPAARPGDSDIDLLVRKWCADGLRIMELLLLELGGRQP